MTVLKLEDATKPEVAVPKVGIAGTGSTIAELRGQVVNQTLGSIETVRGEIDDVLADMKVFSKFEPDMVMAAVSAHSARLIEIIVQIGRIEAVRREWKPVREECDRVLTELKAQFQIASRLMAMRELDWNMSGKGQP